MNLCKRLMGQDQYVALTRTIEELHSNDDNKIGTDNLSSQQCTSIFHHCFSMCWTLKSKDTVEEWTLCQWQSVKSWWWQIEPYSTASLERAMFKLYQVITNKWHERTRMNGCWLNPAKSKMVCACTECDQKQMHCEFYKGHSYYFIMMTRACHVTPIDSGAHCKEFH